MFHMYMHAGGGCRDWHLEWSRDICTPPLFIVFMTAGRSCHCTLWKALVYDDCWTAPAVTLCMTLVYDCWSAGRSVHGTCLMIVGTAGRSCHCTSCAWHLFYECSAPCAYAHGQPNLKLKILRCNLIINSVIRSVIYFYKYDHRLCDQFSSWSLIRSVIWS